MTSLSDCGGDFIHLFIRLPGLQPAQEIVDGRQGAACRETVERHFEKKVMSRPVGVEWPGLHGEQGWSSVYFSIIIRWGPGNRSVTIVTVFPGHFLSKVPRLRNHIHASCALVARPRWSFLSFPIGFSSEFNAINAQNRFFGKFASRDFSDFSLGER